jgi:formylglycine-generating enzyme required for sulfatase activity
VAEWTLDQYDAGWYGKEAAGGVRENPFLRPVTLYPRSVRGGSWDDDAKDCRSAARRKSTPQWKQQDPQLPKSLWYHTVAEFLGFRVVSPAKLPSAEEMHAIWNLGAVGAGK